MKNTDSSYKVALSRCQCKPRRSHHARVGRVGGNMQQVSQMSIFARWTTAVCISFALLSAWAARADSLPPAPDYARADAWVVWPGRASQADVIPPGLIDSRLPASQQVDVFFIHPTTYLSNQLSNARYDEPGVPERQLEKGVLRFQVSAFNACCRIYAPHYRQARLAAFMRDDRQQAIAAYDVAYADVVRAFDYYIEHENHGRPFIIASHSQGSLHAMRLLQERVAGKALQRQLVVAYAIGYYIPVEITQSGIPVCNSAHETNCLIVWNTIKESMSDERRRSEHLVWLDGEYRPLQGRKVVCVNPLSWVPDSEAPANLDAGALPGSRADQELRPLVPQLTAARCNDDGELTVDIPMRSRHGFADALTLFGSYHIYDYNLFYLNIRLNVRERIAAYRASHS